MFQKPIFLGDLCKVALGTAKSGIHARLSDAVWRCRENNARVAEEVKWRILERSGSRSQQRSTSLFRYLEQASKGSLGKTTRGRSEKGFDFIPFHSICGFVGEGCHPEDSALTRNSPERDYDLTFFLFAGGLGRGRRELMG